MRIGPIHRFSPVVEPSELGSVLRVLRGARHWSLSEASEALGIARTVLARAERDSERHFDSAVRAVEAYLEHEAARMSLEAGEMGYHVPEIHTRVHLPYGMDGVVHEVREPVRAPLRRVVKALFAGADVEESEPDRVKLRLGSATVFFFLDGPSALYRFAGSPRDRRSRLMPKRDESPDAFAARVHATITNDPEFTKP